MFQNVAIDCFLLNLIPHSHFRPMRPHSHFRPMRLPLSAVLRPP